MREESIRIRVEARMTQEEAEDNTRPVVDSVDKLVEQFITLRSFRGRISLIDRILQIRTYGLKILMTTKVERTVSWEGGSILVNKIKFSIDDIRTVVQRLYETVHKRVKEIFYVKRHNVLPALDLKLLCDNTAELSEG